MQISVKELSGQTGISERVLQYWLKDRKHDKLKGIGVLYFELIGGVYIITIDAKKIFKK